MSAPAVIRFAVVALAVPFLFGCPVRPVGVASTGQTNFTTARVVVNGRSQRLNFYYSLNPDCSLMTQPVVRQIAAPKHGTVQIAEKSDFTNFAKENQRYDCNKQKTEGIEATYQSDPGYVGPDSATIEVFFASGTSWQETFAITVK